MSEPRAATYTRADRAQVLAWQKEYLEREGIAARIEAVGEVLRGIFFFRMVKREIKVLEAREGRFRTLDPVRALGMRILGQDFGLELEGVDLQTKWDPTTKILNYRAVPSPPVMQQAMNEAMDKLRKKKAQR